MKIPSKLISNAALAAVLLAVTTLGSISQAQLIESGNFAAPAGVTITLTNPGTINVIAQDIYPNTGDDDLTVFVTSATTSYQYNSPVYVAYTDNSALGLINNTTPTLPAGTYTVTFEYDVVTTTGPAAPHPSYTLIAPNEPSAGTAASIATLQSEINTNTSNIAGLQTQLNAVNSMLQGEISTDEANISTLQGQIATLQTQTNANTAAVTMLQNQLATVEQNQATDEANFTSLQMAESNLAAKEQSDVNRLQGEINGIQPASSTVVTNSAHKLNNTLAYAGVGLGIAAIGIGVGDILTQNSANAASTSVPTQTTLKPMTYSESTARTYPGR